VGLLIVEGYVQECVQTDDPELARQRVGRVLEMVVSRFSVPAVEQVALPGDLAQNKEE
jgi:hypothetical protein